MNRAAVLLMCAAAFFLPACAHAAPEPRTPPLTFAGFDPGNIVSDEVFYDSNAMSAQQVEAFIAEVNDGCRPAADGTVCLADYRENMPEMAADDYCDHYEAAKDQPAAQIIHTSAQICGINPQVLLVMLQKEQGLLTASGSRLDSRRYETAMGYACPDSSACDPEFFGFGKQVYYAARQLRKYAENPSEYDVVAGVENDIPFHPNPECGSSSVLVENSATAGLYNYTPYQPNRAAMADPDRCSSFGNLNFFAYYNAWFGDHGK